MFRRNRDPDWFPESEWDALKECLKPYMWGHVIREIREDRAYMKNPRIGTTKLRRGKPAVTWDGQRWVDNELWQLRKKVAKLASEWEDRADGYRNSHLVPNAQFLRDRADELWRLL